jgi:hypothetical protein
MHDQVGAAPALQQVARVDAGYLAASRAETPTDIVVETFLATRAIWQPHAQQQSTLNRSESCTTVRF